MSWLTCQVLDRSKDHRDLGFTTQLRATIIYSVDPVIKRTQMSIVG